MEQQNLTSNRLTSSRFLAALQYTDYRTLWTVNLSSGAAAWALIVARGWLIWDMSDSSLYVGLVTFLAMVPRVLIPPFTGYLADRFDRRHVMAAMFALNLGHNLILAGLIFLGDILMWQVMALAFVNGSARAAQMPVGQALLPNLVPKKLLLNAVALSQATVHGSRLFGPLLICPLLATVGIEWAFLLCTGFYAISLIQTLRIRTFSTGKIDQTRGFIQNFIEGIPYVYKHPQLSAIVLMAFFHCGLTMSFESVLPVLSVSQLGANQGCDFSLLMMAIGAGALISVMTLSGIEAESTKGRLFLNLGLISGLAPVILAFSVNMPMAIIGAIIMGASQAGYMTLTHTMIQSITEDSIRGRVGAIYSVHIGGIMASINLVNGALSDQSFLNINLFEGIITLSPASTMLTSGGIMFIGIVFMSWSLKNLRNIYREGIPVHQIDQNPMQKEVDTK